MILTIVLPVALLTVLSVMVIVVVGVLICIKSSHEKTGGKVGDESEGRERAVTLNLVQNEIYDSPTEKRSVNTKTHSIVHSLLCLLPFQQAS